MFASAPLLTNFGQRQEARRQLREVSLSWVAVVIALVIGAQIMVWCESDNEDKALAQWSDLIARHRDSMNDDQVKFVDAFAPEMACFLDLLSYLSR